jgi:hypothetical protein
MPWRGGRLNGAHRFHSLEWRCDDRDRLGNHDTGLLSYDRLDRLIGNDRLGVRQ